MREPQDIPTGRFQRFMKLSTLSGQVTASALGQKVKGVFQKEEERVRSALDSRLRNAERMVETLGHLKGAVMKVGQMISLHDGEGMSPEVASIWARLQSQAPPLSYARIREQVSKELGAPPEELFQSFESQAFASASLGQVHRAVTREGDVVAVKIQYPGIAETIGSDLGNLRSILDATGLISRRFDTDGIYSEIRARLAEEVDYVREAIHLEEFRHFFRQHPAVVIPRYFPRLSSERILTMEFIQGQSTQEMLAAGLPQSQRDALGILLLEVFLHQLFRCGTIHADPHHGNTLFLPGGRIALLDFGCVKKLEPDFIRSYRALTFATLKGDRPGMVRGLVELGFLPDDRNPAANDLLCEITELFLEPFRWDREFAFGSTDLHLKGADIPRRFLALGQMSFPKDALFLNRVFIGLYFLLRKLEANANWHQILLKHLRT